MSKYLSKNPNENIDELKVNGKLWSCSESLSEKNTKLSFDCGSVTDELGELMNCASSRQKEIIIYDKLDIEKPTRQFEMQNYWR